MDEVQKRIRTALTRYFETDEDDELKEIIDEHPEVLGDLEKGKYPDSHRITDILVGDQIYRVSRTISQDEAITFTPLEFYREGDGVPLWVTGEALKRWAKEEIENPKKEPEEDWSRFFK